MKTGITYKFVKDHQWQYSNLNFPFKEGMEIIFSRVGYDYQNHSEFEIINGKNKGKKFDYDPYSIQLPVIEVKNKIKFSTDDFKNLIKGLQIPNCRVYIRYVEKGKTESKYPCSNEEIISDNCFIVQNCGGTSLHPDEAKSDADTAMSCLLGNLKYAFEERFEMKKLFSVGTYGRKDENNYADSAFQLIIK